MDHDGLATRLVRLGLTRYEAKAYLALLRRDSSTAAEVARLAGVPRQRIYDVLATLVDRGFASARPGRVVKYTPAAPTPAIEQLLAEHRRRVAGLEQEANVAIGVLAPHYEAGRIETDPLEYIQVLRDSRAINERFSELQAGIKREILVFTKPPYATAPHENIQGLEVARRHTARSIYELSAFDDPEFAEGLRPFLEAGEEARFVPELPLKLAIIDETIVLFGMEDPVAGASELTLMVVEHPALARILKVAFEAVWHTGLPFEDAAERLGLPASSAA